MDMVKIYTKTGDQGSTSLGTGETVKKADRKIEAYGTVDELSSFIGLAGSHLSASAELANELIWIQRQLFKIGSILAFPGRTDGQNLGIITKEQIACLEKSIDKMTIELKPLTSFIIPGGLQAAAQLHCARSICRRAERLVSSLDMSEYPLGEQILPFLNRLSDYLFVAARFVNSQGGQDDLVASE